jgi:hypothetical protein
VLTNLQIESGGEIHHRADFQISPSPLCGDSGMTNLLNDGVWG